MVTHLMLKAQRMLNMTLKLYLVYLHSRYECFLFTVVFFLVCQSELRILPIYEQCKEQRDGTTDTSGDGNCPSQKQVKSMQAALRWMGPQEARTPSVVSKMPSPNLRSRLLAAKLPVPFNWHARKKHMHKNMQGAYCNTPDIRSPGVVRDLPYSGLLSVLSSRSHQPDTLKSIVIHSLFN